MRKFIKSLSTKAKPVIERAAKWVIRTAFELLKLTALAFMVMHVIVAAIAVEAILAGIVVFAAVYIPRKSR